MDSLIPEFIYLKDAYPSSDDIRFLLYELKEKEASRVTINLLAALSIMSPSCRLVLNFTSVLQCMSQRQIKTILEDGLLPAEKTALIELDEKEFSYRARATARLLMDVKERWFLSKSIRGFFRSRRDRTDGYIQI
jgi:hypothetical protein